MTKEEKLSRWEDVREIKNLMGRMSADYVLKKEKRMPDRYWSKEEDVSLGVNNGYFLGQDGIRTYYNGQDARIEAESSMIQAAFPEELGSKSKEEIQGVGMMNYKPIDTAVIEVAGDRKTAKGIWMIRGSHSQILTCGPVAYWEWGYFAADFVYENKEWKIWHLLYLTEIDRPCGHPFVGPEFKYEDRPEYKGAADIVLPEPDVPMTVRETYSAERPFLRSPRLPQPYETFEETFSYGYEGGAR